MGSLFSRPPAGVTDVLFFPCKLPCRAFEKHHSCRNGASCSYAHGPTNFTKLQQYLGARRSLDICVFNLTSDDLAKQILALHQRGIRVRLITDDEQASSTGSKIAQLIKGGVSVRHDASVLTHMHHKFAVVDDRLVLNGSLNWTVQGVSRNRENVQVSSDPRAVRAFKAEFERLWREFRNNKL